MNLVSELLPGLEQFLRSGLAKESLSAANEQKRKFFLNRLEVLKYPPSLPPRPEGEFTSFKCSKLLILLKFEHP
jgi:hypothetical protein